MTITILFLAYVLLIFWGLPQMIFSLIKKYLLEQDSIIKDILATKLILWPFFIIVFILDMLGVQGDLGPGILVWPIVLMIAPFVMGSLLVFYYAIFYVILYFLTQGFKSTNLKFFYIVLTLVSIGIFQFLWWHYFYTDISLFRRVFVWNFVIIVFPLIPLFRLFNHHKPKQT